MLELRLVGNRLIADDPSTVGALKSGFYGAEANGVVRLSLIEGLYLMDARNAECRSSKGSVSFYELAAKRWRSNKFLAKYFAYKDWRDRGLVVIDPGRPYKEPVESPVKKYPSQPLKLPAYRLNGVFFKSDLLTVVKEEKEGKELYEKYWFGQYGAYKAADRGKLNKLDIFETLYLAEKGLLDLSNIKVEEVKKIASQRHSDFSSLYSVYSDWRDKGYIIKTGFKFGTNFRVYFPGAKPGMAKANEWMHSRHVIHVFPKNSRLLISEWARAIRVAHSVKKTFLLAMPGASASKRETPIDFVLYHRKGGEADNPASEPPRFAMLALGEEEYLGGSDLASAIEQAAKKKLELLLAIVDRETSVTYYMVKKIVLPGSRHEYYEIDWLQP